MSEQAATISQIAQTAPLLGTSPTRASTVLSILAHVGYNPEFIPATPRMVDRSTSDAVSAREICQVLLGLMPVKGGE